MTVIDPRLNVDRIEAGLRLLAMQPAVEFFRPKNSLIVVFSVEPNVFETGRILSFIEYVRINTGIRLVVARQEAACIKVFFDLSDFTDEQKDGLAEIFEGEEFEDLCDNLSISHIQLRSKIYRPHHGQ